MKAWTRREFGGLAAAALLAAISHRKARSQAKARVVVIGGGVGGATVARYLAAGSEAIAVTLVEPKRRYITCFFSNLYLAGLRSLDSLSHGYETLAERRHHRHPREGDGDRSGREDRRVSRAAPGWLTTGWCLLRALPSNLAASTATMRRRPRSCRMPGSPGRRASCCAGNSKAWRTAACSCSSFRPIRSAARRPLTSAPRWSPTISSSTSRGRRS